MLVPPHIYFQILSPDWFLQLNILIPPKLFHPENFNWASQKYKFLLILYLFLDAKYVTMFSLFLLFYYYYYFYFIVLVLPYINMHLRRVYTCSPSWALLPPPSPYHPSVSSQCTSPKLPVSCIEPGLAIHFLYDIIHVLMPFSQIIPHLPLPQSPKDCSIHLCLFCCLAYRVVVTIFLNSIYMC